MDYSDIKRKIEDLESKVRRNKMFISDCKSKTQVREITVAGNYVCLDVKYVAELAEKQNKIFQADIDKLKEVDKQLDTISGALLLQQFGE